MAKHVSPPITASNESFELADRRLALRVCDQFPVPRYDRIIFSSFHTQHQYSRFNSLHELRAESWLDE
ncbi:MAG: hypothetical protein HQM09_03245 [Candidatus Riflebacteria bacterium]|nr:hypothetical protein [Candidatus Riflebacteria bacterium]